MVVKLNNGGYNQFTTWMSTYKVIIMDVCMLVTINKTRKYMRYQPMNELAG